MKKILLIMLIITIQCCYLTNKITPTFIEKIDLNLKEKELAIINLYFNKNECFLIKTNDTNILLLLELKDKQKLIDNLNDFNIKLDYLISYKDYQIESKNKLKFENELEINNIKIYQNDNIVINYQNHNFCIVNDNINQMNQCNYIYWNNPSDEIEMIKEPELILYQKINDKFLEKTYDKWIDTYYVDPMGYTILKTNDSTYNIINIPIND